MCPGFFVIVRGSGSAKSDSAQYVIMFPTQTRAHTHTHTATRVYAYIHTNTDGGVLTRNMEKGCKNVGNLCRAKKKKRQVRLEWR